MSLKNDSARQCKPEHWTIQFKLYYIRYCVHYRRLSRVLTLLVRSTNDTDCYQLKIFSMFGAWTFDSIQSNSIQLSYTLLILIEHKINFVESGSYFYIFGFALCVLEIPSADVNMLALRRALSKRRRLLVDRSAVSSHSSDSLSPLGPAPTWVTTAVLSWWPSMACRW